MSLREYARKRRFGETPEPDDTATRARRGKRPIFVVQLHHARARHYDFRLEMDGTLKSWAVPKGPSYRLGERRLAVEVEDHPLSYASFEGDIPEGHYGAGHVDIFDHGVWSADGDPLESLAAGKIDFTLHGEKLHGGWKLVRTKQVRSGKPEWLLFKRDDQYAADVDADDLLDAPDKRKAVRGRPQKVSKNALEPSGASPSRPGATRRASPAKKARRSSARKRKVDWASEAAALEGAKGKRKWSPPDPQLATLRQAPPTGDDWLHELKWDGYRLLVDIDQGEVRLRSRNGLDWTANYPDIVAAFEGLGIRDGTFDGELIALTDKGNDDFGLLQKVIAGNSNAPLKYMVFDMPSLEGQDLTATRLEDRKALLEALLEGAAPAIGYSQHIVGHGAEVFAASRKQGMEGIVSKALDAKYTPGRSKTWFKAKHAASDEFVVVGYTPPKGGRTGFGALLMATREHGRLVYKGRVGTGYDDAMLRSVLAKLKPLARKEAVVELPSHTTLRPKHVTWVEPKLVAEIEFRGFGKEGLLRQASFKGLREDKTVKEVGDQAEPVRITSPQKVIFPELKIRKQQVFDYYREVAPLLLPELANRPLSMVRCPDGIKGQCFFQKHHAATLGGNVRAVPIREKDGGHEEYVYVDSVEGLLDLVQMNVLEFHPWGARIEDVEHPDRLVFDLDPGPGVDWNAIKAAARDVRDRLQEIGLKSFLRLSGGKGLHVVLPVAPEQDWTAAKAFCEAFARAMATQAPDRYVATATKSKREGVIFIDWLRNGRGATSVASWSLRARKEAGVAVPLAWSDLGRTKSGHDYPLAKALRRAKGPKADPWAAEGWDATLRQSLPRL